MFVTFTPSYVSSHFVSNKTLRNVDSVIIWLPSSVGRGEDEQKFTLRLSYDESTLETGIL